MTKYSAVIFDLDGTIVDDHDFWRKAFQNTADKSNINKKIEPVAGRSLADSWRINGEIDNAEELAIETRLEFLELIENDDTLAPREGFWELISFLKEKGYVIGLCTSSYWEVAETLFDKMGITGVFDAMTTGEEVLQVKPDPEIYRLTCQKMGVEPEEVIVFEDSEAGIDAATMAGCKVVNVNNEFAFKEAANYFE